MIKYNHQAITATLGGEILMIDAGDEEAANLEFAAAWCANQGEDWKVLGKAGKGGTAQVFSVSSGDKEYALKVFSKEFSEGIRGDETERRLSPQISLKNHGCPNLVDFHDGGRFNDRLYLLMSKAEGQELEKILPYIPRNKIRGILNQVATACQFLRDIATPSFAIARTNALWGNTAASEVLVRYLIVQTPKYSEHIRNIICEQLLKVEFYRPMPKA